jgi:hypothetical protein
VARGFKGREREASGWLGWVAWVALPGWGRVEIRRVGGQWGAPARCVGVGQGVSLVLRCAPHPHPSICRCISRCHAHVRGGLIIASLWVCARGHVMPVRPARPQRSATGVLRKRNSREEELAVVWPVARPAPAGPSIRDAPASLRAPVTLLSPWHWWVGSARPGGAWLAPGRRSALRARCGRHITYRETCHPAALLGSGKVPASRIHVLPGRSSASSRRHPFARVTDERREGEQQSMTGPQVCGTRIHHPARRCRSSRTWEYDRSRCLSRTVSSSSFVLVYMWMDG